MFEIKDTRHRFKGVIVNDNWEAVRASRFVCFGEFSDHTKCFHEVDENGEEIEGVFYTATRKKIGNKSYMLFFVEGVE